MLGLFLKFVLLAPGLLINKCSYSKCILLCFHSQCFSKNSLLIEIERESFKSLIVEGGEVV